MDEKDKAKLDLQILNEEYRDLDFELKFPKIVRVVCKFAYWFLVGLIIGCMIKGCV